jgi:mono/diheme cytochrome c family protein
LAVLVTLVFAHEKTGWIAPQEAKKVKNPIRATQASIQNGKEIYEKKCALCHGIEGNGERPKFSRIKSETNQFQGFSRGKDDRWGTLLENHDRERGDAFLRKRFNRTRKMACD